MSGHLYLGPQKCQKIAILFPSGSPCQKSHARRSESTEHWHAREDSAAALHLLTWDTLRFRRLTMGYDAMKRGISTHAVYLYRNKV